MTYIGGTLYAPTGFDHEDFKIIFEQLAQAGLEINEPSAIGRGRDTAGSTKVRLLIKSALIEDYVLTPLEEALKALYPPEFEITLEAVDGGEVIQPRKDYTTTLEDIVTMLRKAREEAAEHRRLREQEEAHDRELRSMTIEQLRAAGYDEAANKREQEEFEAYSDPEGMY